MNLSDQKDCKKRFYLPHEELLDGVGEEAEQFDLPCPNLATEDTYGDGGEDDVLTPDADIVFSAVAIGVLRRQVRARKIELLGLLSYSV